MPRLLAILAAVALLPQLVDGVYRGNASTRPAQRAATEHSQDILEMFAAQLDREQHRPYQPNQRPNQRPNNNEEEREEERDDDSEGRANEDPEARVRVPNQGREVISLLSENDASSSGSSTTSTNNTAASGDSEERLNQISHSGRNIFLDSSDDDSEEESVICPVNNDNNGTIAASSTTMSAKNNNATSNDSDKESAIQGNVSAINENDTTAASSTMSANANNNTQRIRVHVRLRAVSLSPPTFPTGGEDPSNVDQSTTTHHLPSSSMASEGGTALCDGGNETSNQQSSVIIAAPSNDGTSTANIDSSHDTGGTAFPEINYERIRSLITGEEGEEDLGDVHDWGAPELVEFFQFQGLRFGSWETGAGGDCHFSSTAYALARLHQGIGSPQDLVLARAGRRLRMWFERWLRRNLRTHFDIFGTTSTLEEGIQYAIDNHEHDTIYGRSRDAETLPTVNDWIVRYTRPGAYFGDYALDFFAIFMSVMFGVGVQTFMPSETQDGILVQVSQPIEGPSAVIRLVFEGFNESRKGSKSQKKSRKGSKAGHVRALLQVEDSTLADVPPDVLANQTATDAPSASNTCSAPGKGSKKRKKKQSTLASFSASNSKEEKKKGDLFSPQEGQMILNEARRRMSTNNGRMPYGGWGEIVNQHAPSRTGLQAKGYYLKHEYDGTTWKRKKAETKTCKTQGCNKNGQIRGFCREHATEHPCTKVQESLARRRALARINSRKLYQTNHLERLKKNLRKRTRDGLLLAQQSYVGKDFCTYLACTWLQLVDIFERMFVNGMSWMNQGSFWHIDHIFPLAGMDLSDPVQRARAFHWSNLRPLRASDNMSKGAIIPRGFEWCEEQGRWLWGPVQDRFPEDAHHENLELDSSLGTDEAVAEEEYVLDNDANDADDEDEDEEPRPKKKHRSI